MHPKLFTHQTRGFLIPALLVISLLVAACGGGSSTGPNTSTTAKLPDKQQIFIYPIVGVPDIATLDPALQVDVYSAQAIGMVFQSLFEVDHDGKLVPLLITGYTASADGLTYTFNLKSGITFSDGTPLTSDDVVFSLNRALDPATKSSFAANFLGAIKDVDAFESGKVKTLIGDSLLAPDQQTVVIKMGKKAAYLLYYLTGGLADVIEKSFVLKYGNDFTNHLDQGGGSGPFIVSAHQKNKEIDFAPNPHYWGKKVQLRKVISPFFKDADTTYRAYKAGQVDWANIPSALIDDAKGLGNKQYHQDLQLSIGWISMNFLAKPFDNVHIRQAFALAINKDLIAHNIWKDTQVPTNHIVPKGGLSYNPDLKGPGGVTTTSGDTALAKQLFEQGLTEEGLTRDTLPPITVQISSGSIDISNTFAAIQNMWKDALGINVKIDALEFNKLVTNILGTRGNANVQAFYVGWSGNPDPQNWTTNQFGADSSLNLSNYGHNKAANLSVQQQTQQLLQQADENVTDPAGRIKQYQQAEQQLVNDVTWLPTTQGTNTYVLKSCISGWPVSEFGLTYADWSELFISSTSPCSNTTQYQ